MTRWRREARDLLELWLLPGLAAVLPWALCFPLYRRLARFNGLYRETVEADWREAMRQGWGGENQSHWLWQRRLVTLVDHADLYLSLTRGKAWSARFVDVQGVWPAAGQAALLCTFHWGAGMWGLRNAVAHWGHAHALVAPLDRRYFAGRTLLWLYACLRTREVGRVLNAPALDISASLRPVLRALQQGQVVMAAVDVPADTADASVEVPLLGRIARFPRGLFRVAAQQNVPVSVYITGLDIGTGRRWLRMKNLTLQESPQLLAEQVFAELSVLIAQDAPAWHFWGQAPRIFRSNDE
ncbi:MAG: hypothetical protein Q8S02_08075 [Hydrogenophaga sp.]|nr:hypothetical protein [Hydrogenophaga sp.]